MPKWLQKCIQRMESGWWGRHRRHKNTRKRTTIDVDVDDGQGADKHDLARARAHCTLVFLLVRILYTVSKYASV